MGVCANLLNEDIKTNNVEQKEDINDLIAKYNEELDSKKNQQGQINR